VGVRARTPGGTAVLEIWDSGTGIPAALHEQIFEPFVTTKDVGTGSGLGLFVCRNIITALQGQITAHDAPGGGALFRVTLPLATPAGEATPAPASVDRADPQPRRPRILIIDDDAMVARALSARFAAEAFEVHTILDGRKALEILLSDERVDLTYCDLMMKGFSGIELHEALCRAAPERLDRVVFMTGGAFTPEALSFFERRPDACVSKPFDILADARRRFG
jgi:CheY-like chemotaxis protein